MITINYKDMTNGQKASLEVGESVGIIYGCPANIYHSLKAYTSSSDLKFIHKTSPYHFINKSEFKETDDMKLGSLAHCLILEPHNFANDFFVFEKVDRRTKEGKAIYEAAVKECGSKIMVDVEMLETANAMVDNVRKNNHAMELLEGAKTEVSYFWKCKYSQLNLRSRCDGIATNGSLIELKTTRSAQPKDFERQAYNMNYDLSVKHYLEGIANCSERVNDAYFIVVENTAPYAAQVFKADESFILSGHNKWIEAVDKLSHAKTADKWIMYSDEILPISAPRWAGVNLLEGENDGV